MSAQPLVLHNDVAAAAFYASVLAWLAVEVGTRVRSRMSSQKRTSPDWSMLLIGGVIAVSWIGGYIVTRLRVTPLPGGPLWPLVLGLTLIWGGILLRGWAIVTLGRFFKLVVVIQDDHRVIEHGPYRWLRHPSYLGATITLLGIGVAGGTWLGAIIMLCGPLAAFAVRIRVEERALLLALGDDYAAYARQTARLIPGLY